MVLSEYMPPIHKNQHYELFVMNQGFRGDGITLLRSRTIYIPNALPSDRVEVKIVKICKTFCYGKLTRILLWSHQRRTAPCPIAAQCGGCTLQHQKYQYQLEFKSSMIKDVFKKSSIDLEKVLIPINCSKTEFGYRNKLQVAIQRQGDQICFGLYAARSNRVVPMTTCLIAGTVLNSVFHALQQFVLDYSPTIYDSESSTDGLRHLVIRESRRTQEVMVAMVMSEQNREFETAVQDFCSKLESVKSVMVNYNSEATDEVLGEESQCVLGRPYIVDQVLGLKIKVSLQSFMQANTVMVEPLYQAIMMTAKLTGSENVLDAYCGVGALTLSLAKQAKHVVGVERNPQAIDNAKQNQALNQIANVEFYCESVESWLKGKSLTVDVVVVDPPRQGCHPEVLEAFVQSKIKRIIYCSCNVQTLEKDSRVLLEAGYQCERMEPFDMFAQTLHVEVVATFVLDTTD